MHNLLRQQIELYLGRHPGFTEQLEQLITAINCTYEKNETDKAFLESEITYINVQLEELNQELLNEKYERLLAELQLKTGDGIHDVTGLVNRNILNDRITLYLSLAERLKKPVAILHIGVDNFKLINELMGITAGDFILKTAADYIKSCCRDGDTLAHFSGDEFILVLSPMMSAEDAISPSSDGGVNPFNHQIASIAQRIQRAISEPIFINGQEVRITCCIGICTYPNDGKSIDDLLNHSSASLALAKRLGANHYSFYPVGESERATKRIQLRTQLQHAISRSELELYYQPQIDLITGNIVGAEALIRWNHPEQGLLLPNDFIPLAEESDLILLIDEWVINEACAQLRLWKEKGLENIRIAINISAKQFTNPSLVQNVSMAMAKENISPNFLDVEITESHIIKNVEQAITVLNEIKSLGVQLSIDDFGTGYSSLSYLTAC